MRIAGMVPDAVSPYPGVAFEIYVSGCTSRCNGCHNPEMQDFDYGEPFVLSNVVHQMEKHEDFFDIVSILGGDLADQDQLEATSAMYILRNLFPDKTFWLFTGKGLDNPKVVALYDCFDVIKTGAYWESHRQQGFPASSNQRVYQKSEEGRWVDITEKGVELIEED